ncbi:hypothetical protein JXR93_01205 [bacterium]|nr:hypothetical protein [bacterium]
MIFNRINQHLSLRLLYIQTSIRIVFVAIIFFIDLSNDNESIVPFEIKLVFISGIIVASIAYISLLKKFNRQKNYLFYFQIFLELFVTTGLLFIIHSNTLLIIFLYLLSITNSTIILLRLGAFISAFLSTILSIIVYYLKGHFVFDIPVFSFSFFKVAFPSIVSNISIYFSFAVIITIFVEQLRKQEENLKEKEKELNEQKELKQTIIDSIDSGLIALNRDGYIRYINSIGEKILFNTSFDNYRYKLLNSLTTKIVNTQNEDLNSSINKTTIEKNEINIEKSNESELDVHFHSIFPKNIALNNKIRDEFVYNNKTIGFTINPLNDPNSKNDGFIIIFQDLTEIKKNKEIFARNQRLAYIGQLSASIAHEIRNPLAAISASFQMIKRFNDENEKIERLSQIGEKECNRLNNLIKDFLDYARKDDIEFKNISLMSILKEIQELFLLENKNLNIDTSIENVEIYGDNQKIYQILFNIIKNGFEASFDNTVNIILYQNDDNFTKIGINNVGEPINDEVKKELFLPFFTTKSKGTGLGLAIASKFMDLHFGEITVESSSELGTTFYLLFKKDKNIKNI